MSLMQKARVVVAVIALGGAWHFHSQYSALVGVLSTPEPPPEGVPEGNLDFFTRPDPRDFRHPEHDALTREANFMRTLMFICAAGSILILGRVYADGHHRHDPAAVPAAGEEAGDAPAAAAPIG